MGALELGGFIAVFVWEYIFSWLNTYSGYLYQSLSALSCILCVCVAFEWSSALALLDNRRQMDVFVSRILATSCGSTAYNN